MVDGPVFRFDTGIERVIRHDGFGPARLPELTPILPSGDQVRPHLDEVLEQPSLADLLEAFVRPEMHERDMLLPNKFGSMFTEVAESIGDVLTKRPDLADQLGPAADCLKDAQVDRDLLVAYRNSLLGA